MKNYFDEIKLKLKKQVEIEELVIVDNSHKHKGHKFFSPEKFHLHLKIKSLYLKSELLCWAGKNKLRSPSL